MCKTTSWLFLMVCLFCAACSSEDLITTDKTTTNTTGTTRYACDFSATLNEQHLAENKVATTRAFDFDLATDNSVSIKPTIKLAKDQKVETIVALNSLASGTVLTKATWNVISATTDSKRLALTSLDVPNSIHLNDGNDWFMMVIAGGGTIDGNKVAFNFDTNLQPVTAGETVQLNMPFASQWLQLNTSQNNLIQLYDKSNVFTLSPQASVLVLDIANYASLDIKLSRNIEMESNVISMKGALTFPIAGQTLLNGITYTRWEKRDDTEVEATRNNSQYAAVNGHHYRTVLKLLRSNDKDGSNFNVSGATDYDDYFYFNARGNNSPTSLKTKYILAFYSISDNLPTKNKDYYAQTLFYGNADVTNSQRTHYTNDNDFYQYTDINTWKPRLGKRFLLGVGATGGYISGEATTVTPFNKGEINKVSLRMFRPTLPIEHIYDGLVKEGTYTQQAQQSYNVGVQSFALSPSEWRVPRLTELVPFLKLPMARLTKTVNEQVPMNMFDDTWGVTDAFKGFTWQLLTAPHYTRFNGKGYNMGSVYSLPNVNDRDPKEVYALMYVNAYIDPNSRFNTTSDGTWPYDFTLAPNHTDNYMVAVKFTRKYTDQNITTPCLKIETYYLGPAYGFRNEYFFAYSYCLHPAFWQYVIDKDAVITRYIPYDFSLDFASPNQVTKNLKNNLYRTANESDGREDKASVVVYDTYGYYYKNRYVGMDNDFTTEQVKVIPWLIQDHAW